MVKVILQLALIALVTGCQFQKDKADNETPTPPEKPKSTVSESLLVSFQSTDKSFDKVEQKALKTKNKSSLSYDVITPFPLPSLVPESLSINIFNFTWKSDKTPRIRVLASINDSETELVINGVKASPKKGKDNEIQMGLSFEIHGLKNLFPSDESRIAKLSILLDGSGKTTTITTTLKTPPAKLIAQNLSPDDFYQSTPSQGLDFRNVQLEQHRFVLLRVLEITNDENEVIEINLPQRDLGKIQSDLFHRSYEDLGCNFKIHESRSVSLDNIGPFELIPLSTETLQSIKNRVNLGDAFPKRLSFQVPPKSSFFLGIYGSNQASHELIDQGLPQSTMTKRVVETTCEEKCFKEELKCDPVGPLSVEYMHQPLRFQDCYLVCVDKRTIRHEANYQLGTLVENVSFISSEISQSFSARYLSPLEMNGRDKRLLPLLGGFQVEGLWGP